MTTPWGSIIGAVGNVIDDLVTTDEERENINLKKYEMDVGLQQGQINTNIQEAKHPSRLVAGWRPAAGWVAAISLGMVYIPKAVVMTGIWTYQAIVIVGQWDGLGMPPVVPDFPDLGVTDLIGLLMALLGLTTARSFDKVKKIDTKQIER